MKILYSDDINFISVKIKPIMKSFESVINFNDIIKNSFQLQIVCCKD